MPRYAAKIERDEIKTKLYSYLTPKMLAEDLCEQVDLNAWNEDDTIIYGFEECAIKAANDLHKIDFSLENMTLNPENAFGLDTKQAQDWLGSQTIGDLTVIGCLGGGDWEEPVAFVIYFDGNDFRGYVPTQGNSFDIKSKAAIGTAPAGAIAREFDVEAMKADVASRILVRP